MAINAFASEGVLDKSKVGELPAVADGGTGASKAAPAKKSVQLAKKSFPHVYWHMVGLRCQLPSLS